MRNHRLVIERYRCNGRGSNLTPDGRGPGARRSRRALGYWRSLTPDRPARLGRFACWGGPTRRAHLGATGGASGSRGGGAAAPRRRRRAPPNPAGCGLPRLNPGRAGARRRPGAARGGRGVVRINRAGQSGACRGRLRRGAEARTPFRRVARALREAPGARTRGPTQRVPKNTPDASRTSRPLNVSFNRTARPEGFAIQYSVRPQGSGLVRTLGPKALRPSEPFRLIRAFRLTRSRPRRIRTRNSRLTDAPSAAIIKFAWHANSCG